MIFDVTIKALLEDFGGENVYPKPGRKVYVNGPNNQGTTKAILPGEETDEVDGNLLPNMKDLKSAKITKRKKREEYLRNKIRRLPGKR